MPLSGEQRRIVEESVNHLLEFPTDPLKFSEIEKCLNDAFTISVDKDNHFYWLRECLQNPATYFESIESSGPAVTTGEVREYLVAHISNQLALTTIPLKYWNPEKILISVRELSDHATPFAKQKAPEDSEGEHPYALPNLQGKIYTAMVGLDRITDDESEFNNESAFTETFLQPYVQVNVTCSQEHAFQVKILFGEEVSEFDFATDQDEENFIERLKETAATIAETYAAKCAIHYLNLTSGSEGYPPPDQTDRDVDTHPDIDIDAEFPYSDAVKLLVTDQFYLDQLKQGKIPLSELDTLHPSVARQLAHPEIIRLVKSRFHNLELNDFLQFSLHALENFSYPAITDLVASGACSIIKARVLKNTERTLAMHPVFHPMLKNKELDIYQFDDIDEDHCKLLILPPVANLIRQGKLPFAAAKKLPPELKQVFISNLYVAHFANQHISWITLCNFSKEQCRLLLNKDIARLIANGVIQIEDISKLSGYRINLLQKFPRLLQWMELKLISFEKILHCDDKNLYELYCRAYVKRLYALLTNITLLVNGRADNKESLLEELPAAARECGLSMDHFKEAILLRVVKVIEHHINALLETPKTSPKFVLICGGFLEIIHNTDISATKNWTETFNEIIRYASSIDTKLSALKFDEKHPVYQGEATLFATEQTSRLNNDPVLQLQTFCAGLITISSISRTASSSQEYRH